MDGIESLISAGIKSHIIVPQGAPEPSVEISKKSYSGSGQAAEIPLKDIQSHLKTSLKFKLTVFMYMANSVGNGFYISADESKPTGRKAKELIDDWNETWDMDTLNQLISRDVWSAGNTFLNAVASRDNPIAGVFHLPVSAFTGIDRDLTGQVTNYIYNWGQNNLNKPLKPESILHWAWLPFDEEAFGEGLGQSMARTGLGYKTEAGNTVVRDSWFTASEKIDDISSKMVYAGLPRFFGSFEGEGATSDFNTALSNQMNKLDPLQHLITNVKGTISTVALDTNNRFDSFMRHIDDQMVHGTMSPLIRLWSSLNFTFASSKEAVDAMMPLVSMYQRAHKRFTEKMIYEPIITSNNYDLKKANIKLNWGKQEPLTVEEIRAIFDIIKDPALIGKFNPDDFIKMLIDAGIPLTEQTEKVVSTDLNQLRNVFGRSENGKSIKMRLQKPNKADPLLAKKMKIYAGLEKKYGL